jgi:hypothetical protein
MPLKAFILIFHKLLKKKMKIKKLKKEKLWEKAIRKFRMEWLLK